MYWCCAQTEPKCEAAATHFLGLGGYQVYCPRLQLVRPRHGRKDPPLFPGYLFVLITVGWWSARWSPGVVRLLTAGDAPMPVPDALIAEIRSRERNGLVELPKPPPGLTEVTVKGRHFVQEDSPGEIGQAVADFVRRVRSQ